MLVAAAALQGNAQFQQNFDGETTLPAGWSAINQGDANGWGVSASIEGGAHSGTNAASITYGSTAHDDYLVFPQINVTAGASTRLSFWIKSRSSYYLEPYEVLLSTTNGDAASFTVTLQASQEAAAAWTEKEFDLSAYVGQSVYIAVRATGTDEWQLFVDDAVNDSMPTCLIPTGLNASALTTSGATLGWNAGTEAGTWNVEYGVSGFTQGTGTMADAAVNSITLNTLSSATTYQFYVRKDCGSGDTSDWAGPFSFTTPCEAVSAFTEGFETTATGTVMPTCWSRAIVSASTSSYVYVSTSDVHSGTKALRMSNSDAATATLYAISPQLSNVSSQTQRVRFWAKGSEGITFEVGTIANPADVSTFASVQTITLTTSHQEFSVNFTAASTAAYIAFKAAFTSTYTVVSIDGVVWEPIPSCADVTGVAVSGITYNSANLAWNPVGSAYQYVFGPAATTDPGTLTPVDVAANAATLSLAPQTAYKVWVRNNCSGSFGSWSNPITFTTLCSPIEGSSLPWTEGFEGVTTVGTDAFPPCWDEENGDWITATAGTSTYDSDAHAGNNFVTLNWLATNEYLWTPGFALAANQSYDFSFWYASYGSYDSWDADVMVNTSPLSTGATMVGTPFISTGTEAPSTYTKITRTFTPAADGVYYFAIRGNETTAAPWYLSFDDFELKISSLAAGEFEGNGFKFFPNPVKDVLHLSYTEAITEASVYNMLGQQVLRQAVNANEANLDLSSLQAGTYIVKVASGNAQKTIKIAKQ